MSLDDRVCASALDESSIGVKDARPGGSDNVVNWGDDNVVISSIGTHFAGEEHMSQGHDRRAAAGQARLALKAITLGLVAAALAVPAATAHAATTEFSSSFEASDRPLDWTSTAETDAQGNKKMSGVTGNSQSGIPGSISDKVDAVTASGENAPNETKEKAFDGSVNTKWLVFATTAWLQAELSEPVAVVDYALTSANDAPGRDPKDWKLEGSDDGQSWTTLDTQSGQDFGDRFQTREFHVANTTAYSFYRLDITANHGDGLIQLAELQLSNGDTTPPPPSDMKAFVSSGPVNGPNMLPNAGFTGAKALQYSGEHTAAGHGFAYDKVYDVDVDVTRDTELSYEIFPELTKQDLAYPSTYAAVDLAFSDGTYLSDLHAVDQHGAELSPQGQGAAKILYADQWNRELSRIGDVAAGKTISASSSATTSLTARRCSTAGSTTSPSPATRRTPRARTSPTGPPPRAARTPRAASRAGTTSRRRPCRTASTSGRPRPTLARRAGSTSTSGPTTPTTSRRCRPSGSATSRARGWATARPSRSCPRPRAARPTPAAARGRWPSATTTRSRARTTTASPSRTA